MKKQLLILVCLVLVFGCNDNDDTPLEQKSCCSEDSYIVETDNLPEGKEINPSKYFTPNQDGFHETFYIDGLEDFPDNTVKIFLNNNLVFEANGYSFEDSQNFSSGIYDDNFDTRVYRYELEIDNGDTFKAEGYICAVKIPNINISLSCLSDPNDPDPVIRN
ncbi:T9SS type B sorting domain-containing protein [Aquimarina sp. 2201CG14-23]|uniref:T9SS type B sorting domain-containing protein n=1 Tax=Aquimarina mycalae TaxID=3040073 RepID=UPI002477F9F1|nr:gliding motility-associated C-terminal domain-containing protein [Aquimarina sp. 2201CG14-23]MDH7446339.1 gliding motility-associated C-terminal domain-containing protein [Aquimarina sp. 2201CG14-23]